MELETGAPQGEPAADAQPQVETPSAATPEQNATPATEAQPDTGDEASEERVKREPWFQKRINEVTRQKYEAQREAEELRAKLAAATPAPQPDTGPPTLDDYNWDVEAHAKASAQYWQEQAKATVRAELAAQKAEEQHRSRMQDVQARIAEGAAKHGDFMDAALMIPTNEAVMDFLTSVPGAVDVLYEVGKNPVEADRIFSLTPYQQAAELGRLAALKELPKPTNRTIAPPPPQTVGGLAAGMQKPAGEMSMTEYAEARRKGLI